jgi:endo-1,4-beta-xylanase
MFRRTGVESGSAVAMTARALSGRTAMVVRLVAMVLALLWIAPAAQAGVAPIPEGAAVWFACTEPTFDGPLSLRCPLPYDPSYVQTFLNGFSRLTPENEFKMVYTEPEENRFAFSVADQVAEFARAHGKTIRGHTLLWNEEMPFWLSHPLLPWTAPELTEVMHTYITTVVNHFQTVFPGVVTEWDVINEPLTATGRLASSPWLNAIGPGYIRLALEYAHAADPAARLMINEQDADSPGPEANGLLALATSLKQAGVPLSGVGFEAHVTTANAPSLEDLVSLWRRYAAVGLDVEVTELDVDNINGVNDPAAKLAVFERYAEACRIVGNCTGLTVWGVADSYSWLGSDTDALLYNSDFQPTAAATAVRRILDGLPATVSAPSQATKVNNGGSGGPANDR